jgi:RNA polymerase sigma-70 factor (ECF subfamily)
MQSTDPDRELVRLAQLGDASAFEALVVKYQRRVARHVARWVKRAADVEDVVQDVFIKVYRGLASFKGDSAFYTWVYQIARNTAFNFLSRQSRVVVLRDDHLPDDSDERSDEQGSDHEDPERQLLAQQISETVELAMKKLQPELAEALVLYEVEGKQYKEIAQMLQIPIGTVRTRIFRAREFIAKRLEPVVGPVRDRRW